MGVWDVPNNGDFIAADGFFGGVQTVNAAGASPITLTSPSGVPTPSGGPTQAQNAALRFTGALSGNVQITLPLPGYMIVENLTTGAFVLIFRAIGSGEVIGIEQGSVQHIYNDGTNVRFVNLPPVGTYLDICDASVPAWITACTKPPYLNCNGGSFSAGTYPYLNAKLGGNTLPDFKGRAPYYLNQGSGRLTAAGAGIDGDTRFAAGGSNGIMLGAAQIPSLTVGGNITVNYGGKLALTFNNQGVTSVPTTGGVSVFYAPSGSGDWNLNNTQSVATANNMTYTNGGQTIVGSTAPGVVSGLRLIRAA